MPLSFRQGDVVSYMEMCTAIGASLQRGMNYRLKNGISVVLMSRRPGAPYLDEVSEDGKLLIYEGHDCSKSVDPNPKQVDQPEHTPGGSLTQNGLFAKAVKRFQEEGEDPDQVMVFEKLRDGIWVFNGLFDLVDCEQSFSTGRRVFKFRLKLASSDQLRFPAAELSIGVDDDRVIPSWVKLEVWKRDLGKCVQCGAQSHLHFDHVIPYSKGGSSKDPKNIQILCSRHNLQKHDRIE
jgi:hypothetical protein